MYFYTIQFRGFKDAIENVLLFAHHQQLQKASVLPQYVKYVLYS